MKTFCAVVRDHSASMRPLAKGAMLDYNLLVDGLMQSSAEEDQEIRLTVVECGVGHTARVSVKEVNENINNIRRLSSYDAHGSGTPLWDSVGEAINKLTTSGAYVQPSDAFLVMMITDGAENASRIWTASSLKRKIAELQNTDKWTFVFRVPSGMRKSLIGLGIPEGNIMEWEQTEQALSYATQQNVSSTKNYFKERSAGVTKSGSFFINTTDLKITDVKHELVDVSHTARTLSVLNDGIAIRPFVEGCGFVYQSGKAYYELTKRETIQQSKSIAVKDVDTGKIYTGPAARQLLGIPTYGDCKVLPVVGSLVKYKIFVQSLSVTRKLVANTELLYFGK